MVVPVAHMQQYRRVHGAGIEQQSGTLDPLHVGDRHRHDPIVRHERGEAQSQHHGVRPLDLAAFPWSPAGPQRRVGRGLVGVAENDWGGAPTTPEKTWFQMPLDQPPISLFRTRNCCCEPLMMKPVWESEMKPPLANCA
jgi:hypothetical protein